MYYENINLRNNEINVKENDTFYTTTDSTQIMKSMNIKS